MTATASARNGTFPGDSRSAAELYILRHGLAPIPVPTRDKDPRRLDWQHMRLKLSDLDQHFPPGEARNIGILNGAPSDNKADVDLDVQEARAIAPHLLPPTGWVFGRQSSQRSHWIYCTDTPINSSQIAFEDTDGKMLLELRGTGGMTVYPPSIHEEGEAIAWDEFGECAQVAKGDLRRAVEEVAAATILARHWPAKGNRDRAAMALTGGLSRSGWPTERVEKFVGAVAVGAGDDEAEMRSGKGERTEAKLKDGDKVTGWPKLAGLVGEQVVTKVLAWLGLEKQSGKVPKIRTLPPYQPFPVDVLPAPLAEYVRQVAKALGVDPAFVALPVLAVVASVIGNTRTIRLKRTWEEVCVLWAAIIGDSGTLKTPAYRKALLYLFKLQRDLVLKFKAEQQQYLADVLAHKEEKKNNKDAEPPPPPVLQRLVCSDTTVEKLAENLEDNPRGILMARDELNAWFVSFTRYKGKSGGSDLPNWLEAFQAGTVMIDRKTGQRPTLYVHRAAVSVTGGIQPGVLAKAMTSDFLDAGGGARLLLAMPPKQQKQWSDAEVDPCVEEVYDRLLDRLLQLEFHNGGSGRTARSDGEKMPYVLVLSSEAKALWVEFYNQWAAEQEAAEGELAAAFSKLEGYAARLALLHHVVSHVAVDADDRRPVGTKSIEAGVLLVRWFANEARRVYATLTETADERETRRLLEWVQARGGSTTVKKLQRSNSRKYPTAEAAELALQRLVNAELGRWVNRPTDAKGGRPTRDFVLNKASDDTDETSADGGDGDGPASDDTPDDTPPGARVINVPEGFVGNVSSRTENQGPQNGTVGPGGFVGQSKEVSSDAAPEFQVVTKQADLAPVRVALDNPDPVGLDLETTGLDPRTGKVRLLSLNAANTDGGRFTYLVDCFAVDPSPLWELLSEREVIVHNGAFDLAFLARLGFTPGAPVHDTMLMSQLLYAGERVRHRLPDCVERELAGAVDKTERKSDWSGTLTAAQLHYAAKDVDVLAPLCRVLKKKIHAAACDDTDQTESRCLPALVWMGGNGVAFDKGTWNKLAAEADAEANRLAAEMDAIAPPVPETLVSRWKWDSPQDVQLLLKVLGYSVENSNDGTLAAIDHPLAQLLRQYREARKKVTTYGTDWLSHVAEDGRVYPHWKQLGAASGRMSCTGPNMQQLPRGEYRRCVVAPPGRVLVKADYSQIELRIAAKVSGDKALLDVYLRGDDLHTMTARNVLGVGDVTKQHRQLAKALNFGLIYGMGAAKFRDYAKAQYGVELAEDEAQSYRRAFFDAYPGLRAWHNQTGRTRDTAIETRTLANRRRLAVQFFTEKLNTPVQGTGADGLKVAIALLWERRGELPAVVPVLAVHDEIVAEAPEDQADAAAAWLTKAMVDAMAPLIAPVPVVVETKVARTWGGD